MSKQRARRRAERAAARTIELARRQRRARRRRVWVMLSRGAVSPLRWSVTALGGGTRRPDSVLARRRARQNGALAAFLGGANVVLWLLQPTWGWHLGVAVASVGLWPLLTVVVFDRRGSG